MQKEVAAYYSQHIKRIHKQYDNRRALLHDDTKRILVNYCGDEMLAEDWLARACRNSDNWPSDYFVDVIKSKKSKRIMRKLISFSNEYNHMLYREKIDVGKYTTEKKRLVTVLSKAMIGNGYDNICEQLANEECPQKVMAVLRDIRFGKDERNKFRPSRVELVFALTAVSTEISINLVHNEKWSNYERILEILKSKKWCPTQDVWDAEIAKNNNKIIERKIVTGNILGAYVHPAIAKLKPRFITFSLKRKEGGKVRTQYGLLLPIDEGKIRKALSCVTIPLNEGLKYANNENTSYTIAGLGVNFSLLPFRDADDGIGFIISVEDSHSKAFEGDERFDKIRTYFTGNAISSIYDRDSNKKKRKVITHYQTDKLSFESEAFQTIIQSLSQMDAVLIVPRDQMTYGDVRGFSSRSMKDSNEPWSILDWKSGNDAVIPPVKETLMLRISAPMVQKPHKGQVVTRHSDYYTLAEDTVKLKGLQLGIRSTIDALRRIFLKWKKQYTLSQTQNGTSANTPSPSMQRYICGELRKVIENKNNQTVVDYNHDMMNILQNIIDSEYLEPSAEYMARFDNEMLFMSPSVSEVQTFADELPCSPRLDGIRKCLQDYIDGKTKIINSPTNWV